MTQLSPVSRKILALVERILQLIENFIKRIMHKTSIIVPLIIENIKTVFIVVNDLINFIPKQIYAFFILTICTVFVNILINEREKARRLNRQQKAKVQKKESSLKKQINKPIQQQILVNESQMSDVIESTSDVQNQNQQQKNDIQDLLFFELIQSYKQQQ